MEDEEQLLHLYKSTFDSSTEALISLNYLILKKIN